MFVYTKRIYQRGATGGLRAATSAPRPVITMSAKLFVNLLRVTTSSFILFTPKDLQKKIVIFISSAALRTSALHA
jgi:hypothetical protein